jgi:hypothetical protein
LKFIRELIQVEYDAGLALDAASSTVVDPPR